jgi:alkylated DNA nucleotide flippase Atl1
VDICCPITTGIFAWIASHAAQEAEDAGAKRVTPWWRTLKSGGELNPKYPGGIEQHRARLEAEGHIIARQGKKYVVEGFEKSLAKLTR